MQRAWNLLRAENWPWIPSAADVTRPRTNPALHVIDDRSAHAEQRSLREDRAVRSRQEQDSDSLTSSAAKQDLRRTVKRYG